MPIRVVTGATVVGLVVLALAGAGGAATPTIAVVDITPGADSTYPDQLATLNGKLLFSGYDPAHGRELWVSDGTAAGSAMVKDIRPGSDGSDPATLIRAGNYVYFTADDGTHGYELWRTDGTAAGTILVRDIAPGGDSGSNGLYVAAAVGSTLYFPALEASGDQALWRTNGSEAGTTMVKDFNDSGNFLIMEMLAVDGDVYLSTYLNGTGNGALWVSDGTEAGTTEVKTFSNPCCVTSPENLRELGGDVYFSSTAVDGSQLWRSDGTEAGTVMVTSGEYTELVASAGGSLWLYRPSGLWKSDGTTAGTVLVSGDVFPGGDFVEGPGGYLYFQGGQQLWRTDGTEAGTTLVIGGFGGGPATHGVSELTYFGGTLFFAADDGEHGDELWTTNGTEAGTVLHDINPKPGDVPHARNSSNPHDFTELNGDLYFSADDGAGDGGGLFGSELWAVRGGAAITQIDPQHGCAGTKIKIKGKGLAGATAVTIAGTPVSSFNVKGDQVITAIVAGGTTSGQLSVNTPLGTATAGDYVVPAPKVFGFGPKRGSIGAAATLIGRCLSGATAVTFNGTPATSFSVVSDTRIAATVPGGATTGRVAVTTPNGTGTSSATFKITS